MRSMSGCLLYISASNVHYFFLIHRSHTIFRMVIESYERSTSRNPRESNVARVRGAGSAVDGERASTPKHHFIGTAAIPLLCLSHEKVTTHFIPFKWRFVAIHVHSHYTHLHAHLSAYAQQTTT